MLCIFIDSAVIKVYIDYVCAKDLTTFYKDLRSVMLCVRHKSGLTKRCEEFIIYDRKYINY